MNKIRELRRQIMTSDILDNDTIHHEFASGLHGRKLDMDKIQTTDRLYDLWIDALVDYIRTNYDPLPDAIVGVANGANRLAVSVASRLGNGAVGLVTVKESSRSATLDPQTTASIQSLQPEFALILEDVGTSGSTAATVAKNALALGIKHIEVLNTWQRSDRLATLDEIHVPYRSMIVEPLPNYNPHECEYCNRGVKLINHA